MRAKVKLRKVSRDVLKKIIEILKELEKSQRSLLRKYFDLGRWVDLAVEEGASYQDIAEALADHQIYGYSKKSLHRAHKFFRYVVENFGGDIEKCIKWMEDKYPELKVEYIDLLTRKKPSKAEEEIDQQLSMIGEKEEAEEPWYFEREEYGEPAESEEAIKPPSWITYREELAKRKPANWRNLGPKASKENKMIQMIDYEIWEFHNHLITLLVRARIPEDYVSKIGAAVEEALLRLRTRLLEEWRQIEKEAMAA